MYFQIKLTSSFELIIGQDSLKKCMLPFLALCLLSDIRVAAAATAAAAAAARRAAATAAAAPAAAAAAAAASAARVQRYYQVRLLINTTYLQCWPP